MADPSASDARDDALKLWLEASIAHPTDQISIHTLQAHVLENLQNGELPVKRVIVQTLAAATRCQSRATEAHLRALMVEANAAVDGFATAFASVLSARAKTFVQSFASARLIVLRLSCALVDAVEKTLDATSASQPAWLADVAKTQSLLLEAMLQDPDRVQAVAHKTLLRLLRTHQALVPVYVAVLTDAAPELQQYALWLVLRPLALDTAVHETLWTKYAFWAFESKTRSLVTLKTNDLRFKGITPAQFDALLKPTIAKALKKSPDSVLEAVVELVRAVPLDLGTSLNDVFLSVILAKLKSTKEDVRGFTLALAKELLCGFQSVDHFTTLVTQLAAMVEGKLGLLAQFYMREAAYAVLADAADAIASLGNAADATSVAAIAIPSLLKALDKEAHDQARHLGLLALGKWLAHTNAITKDVLTKAQAGVKNKSEAVVAGYLRALAVFALQAKSGLHDLAPLASELTRIVVESNKKPAITHLDGVLALGVAGALALSSSELDQTFTKDGVARVLLDTNSFVIQSVKGLLNTLAVAGDNGSDAGRTKPEVTALVALARALSWVLSSKQEDATVAYRVLVELLTSPVLPVRKAAEAAISTLYAGSLEHVDALLVALQAKLSASAEQLEKDRAQSIARKPSTVSDEASGTQVAVVPAAGVLRRALRVIVPQQIRDAETVRDAVFPRAMVVAHHPFVVDGRSPTAFASEWNTIRLRFLVAVPATETEDDDDEEAVDETVDDRVDHFMEAHESIKGAFVALLTNDATGQLFSPLAVERLGAQRALATMLNFAGNGEGESIALHEVVEEALIQRIEAQAIDQVTDEDAYIFETPFDELYVASKAAAGEATSTQSTARRGGGGRRGNEEEQWEQQVREELERKKAQSAAAGNANKKLSPEEKAQLAQQQARRVQLRETIAVVEKVVETIDFVGRVRPDELHPALPQLLRSLVGLFQSRIFDGIANDALDALAKSISPVLLRDHASDVASALRVVLRVQQDASLGTKAKQHALSQHNDLFVRTLASFMDFAFGFQFDSEEDYDATAPVNRIAPPTLHMVFPVLSMLLHYDPQLRRWALPLFAAHAHMIPEEEEEEVGDVASQRLLRKDMLELVLHMLAQTAAGDIVPISNDDLAPVQLLSNVCEGPELTTSEWSPVLGDAGLLSQSGDVRHACLKAIQHVAEDDESELTPSSSPLLASRLFLARFDAVDANRSIATSVWEHTASTLTKLFAAPLLVLLNHSHENVRESASLAIADGMTHFPETITPILNNLKAQFQSHLPQAVEDIDAFGNPTLRRPGQGEPLEEPETYTPRCGVALCLEKIASSHAPLPKPSVVDVVAFVIDYGLADPNGTVRAHMRKTSIQFIDAYGGSGNTSSLLQIFEQAMEKKPVQQKGVDNHKAMERYDHQREGIVVCLGALAKHMEKTDPKVSSIVDSLVDALSIPSESVQRSVATCLAPLIPAVKDRSAQLLTDLLTRATTSETFGERIGAAFGVSAVVKGLGISALKQHDVIPRIEDMMKSGGANARQGAMLIFECLSARLNLLFEPYIIVILPIMLKCYADASPQVREAASETSKKIMANLSAHGVKLVLPSLLRSLEDGAWRTKQAGIQLLGTMAYCAPRQLGSCLPQVVPKITAALTDSHPKIREASKAALRDVGSVVRNPEIASISTALLNALEDPNKYMNDALQQLQSTSFQHSVDAPSLALVMPIITRGLKDRGGDAKKKSALIVGSMCSVINDAKDLAPYMEMVLPSLKTLLMDPIPEVRAVSSKAMGKLVKGVGEAHFSDILTWLLEAIKGDFGSVERSGAAQGLCEVLVALGKDRVEATLFDEIFPLARHPKYSVREGVLWIIAFLPPALGKAFAVFISDALPIIVSGLSDEADSVRDVAMHAGHVVVNAHALSHTRDILPSLEAGLFDDSWRIRQSSVQLLGDLMYRISGTRAVGVTADYDDEDDESSAGSAAGDKAIIKTLGMERRNAILASLYMIRSDTSAVVRQSSLQVWKSVVANTPKTLRQILPTLMNVIVSALSGDHVEKQTMAGRTLGEIVRKLGENVLPEIVPILRDGLVPTNSAGQRQGACVGLSEVIDCCTKKQLEDYVTTLVDAILDGLCDELPLVRASAAQAFNGLQRNIGYRAIDETVPALLHRIKSSHVENQERALNGLEEIMRVKAREVLPYLMPRLLTTPLSLPACRAISRVAKATGPTIHFHLEKILMTFVPQYLEFLERNPTLAEDIKLALRDVVLAVENAGVHSLAVDLCKLCEKPSVDERSLGFYLIGEFCGHTTTTYTDQAPLYLRQIVTHLNDAVEGVVKAASDALKGMNNTLRPEAFANHVDFIRQGISSLVSDARHRKGGVGATGEFLLPGLCIPKGLEPFLPSYQYALMNGSPELRQTAAAGLGELVQLSSAVALRPYLIKLTGPLIRIAGDRFPGHVKAAILQTLEIILEKGGVALKPFLPQLQTTFVKALNDSASEVRARGTSALSKLVALSPRIDPLVAELTEKIGTTSGGIREANVDAITSILRTVGDKVSSPVRATLEDALVELLEETDDDVRSRATTCLVQAVATDPHDDVSRRMVRYGMAHGKDVSGVIWTRKQSAAAFLEQLLVTKHAALPALAAPIAAVLTVLGEDEHIAVRSSALRAVAALVKLDGAGVGVEAFVPVLAHGIAHANKDVSKTAAKIAKRLAKRDPVTMRAHAATLVPPTFSLIKSNNIAAKLTAERALLYLLEVHTRPESLDAYVKIDAANGKVIAEYARRVLAKLKADSGDESE